MSEQNQAGTTSAPAQTVTETTPPAATSTAAPTPTSWIESLGDLKGYAELKGWKEPKDVVSSYQNFEKFKGIPQERLLTLPEKDDDPNWGNVYQRLGKPATKDDYKIDAGEKETTEFVKNLFHESNLTQKQAENVLKKFTEFNSAKAQEAQKAVAQKLELEAGELKKEWGLAYNENVQKAKNAAQKLGIDGETIDALESVMGHKKLMGLFAKIGTSVSEDSFVSGKSQQFQNLTPDAARAKIGMLMTDKAWSSRYIGGEKSARQEFEALHKMAYPTN